MAQPRHAQTESDAPHVLGPEPVAGRVERGQRERPVPPLALDEVLFFVGVVQRRRVADEGAERPAEGGPEPGRVVLTARIAVAEGVVAHIQHLEGRRVAGAQRAAEFYYCTVAQLAPREAQDPQPFEAAR